jgi:hypothetical protein
MKKFITFFLVFSLLSISGNFFSPVLWAEEKFQARLLPEMGRGSQRAKKLIISIESYTSAEEIFQLIQTFNTGGFDQFRSAFRAMNKGSVRPRGGSGLNISLYAAQNIQTDKGRQIILVAESQSLDPDVQLRLNSRFPFMVIEFNINKKGKGKGKLYLQANIRLTHQGTIERGSYSLPPKQLFGVSTLK